MDEVINEGGGVEILRWDSLIVQSLVRYRKVNEKIWKEDYWIIWNG